jgi:cell division protein FtsI/penicillin-binding protein 2
LNIRFGQRHSRYFPPLILMDTRSVLRRTALILLACASGSIIRPAARAQSTQSAQSAPAKRAEAWAAAVSAAAQTAPDARIVVLDLKSGRVLASNRLEDSAHTLAAPGSTLKPIALYSLIAAGHWDPARRIACTRKLRIAGRELNCPHPPSDPMNAREALTWSCNTYFATVATALHPGELRSLLAPSGLLGPTGRAADESTATFRDPRTPAENQLALLGIEGIRITPLELAIAYRWLNQQFALNPGTPAAQTVRAGLQDSASFGMAGQAGLGGVSVMGKTGTAEGAATAHTHGWFTGIAPIEKSEVVLVVYAPAGHGADAAHIAAEILAHSLLKGR